MGSVYNGDMTLRRCVGLACLLIAPAAFAEPVRVAAARKRAGPAVRAIFEKAGATYPAAALLLRAFKLEGELELWAAPERGAPYVKLKSYPVCARSGDLGPKRREGDGQVPEGFYQISQLNPWSSYHLSLRVDYPNRSDRKLGARGRLGGDIFIHGQCVTIGCLPMGDEGIEEIYLIAQDARRPIDVQIFPARLDAAGFAKVSILKPGLIEFWKPLQSAYEGFERTHRLPRVKVLSDGRYSVTN